jgi:hypothetical protein
MYDYQIVSKITELKAGLLDDLNNFAVNVGISDNLRELAMQHDGELKNGWEIVSHDIVFYQDRQIFSLLLRRQRPNS